MSTALSSRCRLSLRDRCVKRSLVLFQIIASCSTVYDIPWPTSFLTVVSNMRVFLVDVISITKGKAHL